MTTTTTATTSIQSQNPHHRRRWLILAVVGIAQLMVILDSTIVNIALPSAQGALQFSDGDRQWVVSAYALAFGSLLLVGGRISDIFGRKWAFVGGLLGFAVASAVGGAAQSFDVLIAARALQGAFGALLAPAALSLLTTTFTDEVERNRAFGIFGAVSGAGAAVGLLLGGILTEYLTWRWCLYVNLIFAAVAIAGALPLLANLRPDRRPPIDVAGTATSTGGLFALVYGVSEAESKGWGSPLVLGLIAVGLVLLVSFVLIERRSAHPLLPLHVVLDRNRGGAFLALGLASAAIFGVNLFLIFFLQQTLGFSPVECGLAFLPLSAAIIVAAATAQTQGVPRVGGKPLLVAGMALGAVSLAMLAQLSVGSSYAADVLPALLVLGVGFGLVVAPALALATLGIDDSDTGVASAMVNIGQQLGGSIGIALLTTFFSSAVSDYIASNGSAPEVARAAAVHGYTIVFWWGAGIFAVGALILTIIMRRGVPTQQELSAAASPAG